MTQEQFYEAYRHTARVHGISEDGRRILNHLARFGRTQKNTILVALGWQVNDASRRRLRKDIELLKRAGIPVLASSGSGDGHWLASTEEEIEEYIAHELDSRMASLADQRSSLRATVVDVKRRAAEVQGVLL